MARARCRVRAKHVHVLVFSPSASKIRPRLLYIFSWSASSSPWARLLVVLDIFCCASCLWCTCCTRCTRCARCSRCTCCSRASSSAPPNSPWLKVAAQRTNQKSGRRQHCPSRDAFSMRPNLDALLHKCSETGCEQSSHEDTVRTRKPLHFTTYVVWNAPRIM